MLEDLYEVELAENMEEAKNRINNSFQAVIIDINLDRFNRHNKDGITLALWIKEKYSYIKIILVTAFFESDEVEKTFDSFIQKPIIEEVLKKEMKKLIGN